MLMQLEVKDNQSEFILNLFNQLKSSIDSIKIIQPVSDNEKNLDDTTDEQKWEEYGNWNPSAENMDMCYANMMNKLDEEYGSEDYKTWQK